MNKIMVSGSIIALTLSACAKTPESIQPAYVSPMLYNGLSCEQLGEEMARVTQALTTASQQQEDARTNDTIGVIFLGLPVSSLSGGNVAPQIAELKGEQKALHKVMIQHQCSPTIIAESERLIAETEAPGEEKSEDCDPNNPTPGSEC